MKDAQTFWDMYSQYIDDDIDSLQQVAGRNIITKTDFFKAFEEYDAQDRWVKVDKDNLPTEKVFACNKHEEYLVGHIHLHNGIIVCSADETVLYYVTHYQIPTAPKD